MRVPIARALGATLVLSSLTFPTLARANGPFDPRDPRTGIQVAAFGGVGGFSNGAAFDPYDYPAGGPAGPSIGVQAEVGYRFVPLLSAGLHGTLQVLDYNGARVNAPSDARGWADANAVGVYARVHPLALLAPSRGGFLSRLDAHASIGFDFLARVDSGWQASVGRVHDVAAGVAMPVSVGVDFALTSWLAVSVLGQWSYWTTASVTGPEGGAQQSFFQRLPPGCCYRPESYLFAGLGLRGTFNILH